MMRYKHFLMDTFGGEGGDAGGSGGQEGNEAPTINNETSKGATEFTWPENWKEHLPDEIKGEKSLSAIADIPNLAKSFVNAQKMVGQNKVNVPDPKLATDDDWRNFFVKAGLPEKPDDYKIEVKEPDALPEGFLDTFQQKAHELNILPHQAQNLLEWYRDYETQAIESQTEEQKAELERIHGEYQQLVGQAYKQKIAYANKVVDEFGSPELSQMLVESGLNKHPEILKMFSTLGEKMFGEDVVLGENGQRDSAMTPDEAKEKWSDIRGDKDHPYWNARHPNHKKALQEVQKLFQFMG